MAPVALALELVFVTGRVSGLGPGKLVIGEVRTSLAVVEARQ